MPWTHKANAGPDSKVPGWFYNLGITGLRVELVNDHPLGFWCGMCSTICTGTR